METKRNQGPKYWFPLVCGFWGKTEHMILPLKTKKFDGWGPFVAPMGGGSCFKGWLSIIPGMCTSKVNQPFKAWGFWLDSKMYCNIWIRPIFGFGIQTKVVNMNFRPSFNCNKDQYLQSSPINFRSTLLLLKVFKIFKIYQNLFIFYMIGKNMSFITWWEKF